MKIVKRTLTPPAVAEVVFDTCYLIFVVGAGIYMTAKGQTLYGIMAMVLGFGDSFHLIPRILGHLSGMERYQKSLGIGKLVTSITMTVFYLLLYGVWAAQYDKGFLSGIGILLCALGMVRVLLCLFPQNRWTEKDAPVSWAVYRNIPFMIMGVIIILLFIGKTDGFRFMSLAVFLSFLFYIPVVLWSGKNKKIGALMMPKTMAYLWIVCMGFSLLS